MFRDNCETVNWEEMWGFKGAITKSTSYPKW